jgi:hypothetical protein
VGHFLVVVIAIELAFTPLAWNRYESGNIPLPSPHELVPLTRVEGNLGSSDKQSPETWLAYHSESNRTDRG